MAVATRSEPTFKPEGSRLLFEGPYLDDYDVAPDGRFVMIQRGQSEAPSTEIVLVHNWFEELRHRVPMR